MSRLTASLLTLALAAAALLPAVPAEAATVKARAATVKAKAVRKGGWHKLPVGRRASKPAVLTYKPAGLASRRAPWLVAGVPRGGFPSAVAVTGRYGPDTAASVRRYQLVHGLVPSGVADAATTWSLGLVVPGPLYPGQAGPGVRALQRALRHHERFTPRVGRAPRPHRPAPGQRPQPQPVWAPPAEPFPILEPVQMPVVVPPPAAQPAPAAVALPWDRPWLELRGAGWTAPVPAGGPPALFGGGGALWLGDWGVAADYSFAPDLGKVAPGDLIDGQLRFRGLGPLWVGLGYRGFAGEHLGAGALGLDQPLGLDWLRLRAAATGGSNFGPGWVADGRGGLALLLGPVTVEGGYQALAADAVGGLPGMGLGHGTYARAGLQF